MDRVTCEPVTIIAIPPAKLFKALVLDADNLIPKFAPHAIQKMKSSTEMEGRERSRRSPLVKVGSHCKYVKYRMDKVDDANFNYGYSLIEGDALGEVLEKISYETTFVLSGPLMEDAS
ncbi:Major allergen Mal d 1 [Morella rubra]|uniref:Major allergen Mal d 1 n=1 Tax=Morella rubra TaxID=262757 RepID=A0A6A1VMF1_9ROSI|nr:Major allergen Mal d 1 [Morella rubra]